MKNKEILKRMERALHQAPIDLYPYLQTVHPEKMEKHDAITRQTGEEAHQRGFRPLTAGITFALMLLIGLGGWQFYFLRPDSYIYFDVNPGIEIVTNRQNQVIDLIGVNEEGEALVKSIEFRRMGIELVQARIMDRMMEEGFLNDPRQVMLVSGFNKSSSKSEALIVAFDQRIHAYLEDENVQLVVLRQVIERNSTLEEFSQTHHMTMGRITFIRNLMILNPDFRLESLVDLSLEELLRISLQTGLEIDRIIESDDRLEASPVPGIPKEPKKEPEPAPPGGEQPQPPTSLTMEEAMRVALGAIGGGTVVKMEYDEDDREYAFTIHHRGYEYEVEVNAFTGKIIDIDSDALDDDETPIGQGPGALIGIPRAREIALGRVGGGRVEDIALEEEDGRLIYEIEVEYNGKEYDIEIDAYTGAILFFEAED